MKHRTVKVVSEILLPEDWFDELKNGSEEGREDYLSDLLTDIDMDSFVLEFPGEVVDLSQE